MKVLIISKAYLIPKVLISNLAMMVFEHIIKI
jgi:hypothetical protein